MLSPLGKSSGTHFGVHFHCSIMKTNTINIKLSSPISMDINRIIKSQYYNRIKKFAKSLKVIQNYTTE